MFDKDGNGRISTKELKGVMKSLGQNVTDAEVQSMIKKVDLNHDGEIDFEEFVKMMNACKPTTDEEKLKDAFRVFDKDGNGYITVEEMK